MFRANPGERLTTVQRRKLAAELHVRGWTNLAIADHCRVTIPTIVHDLQEIRRQWRESTVRNFDDARELEFQKIDQIEREAWEAWDRSQRPEQTATVTVDGGRQRSSKSVRNQTGDARYLEVVQRCILMRCKLLGIQPDPHLEMPTDGLAADQERRDRIFAMFTQLRDQQRITQPGTRAGADQPGDVRPTGE